MSERASQELARRTPRAAGRAQPGRLAPSTARHALHLGAAPHPDERPCRSRAAAHPTRARPTRFRDGEREQSRAPVVGGATRSLYFEEGLRDDRGARELGRRRESENEVARVDIAKRRTGIQCGEGIYCERESKGREGQLLPPKVEPASEARGLERLAALCTLDRVEDAGVVLGEAGRLGRAVGHRVLCRAGGVDRGARGGMERGRKVSSMMRGGGGGEGGEGGRTALRARFSTRRVSAAAASVALRSCSGLRVAEGASWRSEAARMASEKRCFGRKGSFGQSCAAWCQAVRAAAVVLMAAGGSRGG